MNAIIITNPRLLLRLAHRLEAAFPDAEECIDVGDGPHESRPEYRRKYKRCRIMYHPDGSRAALILPAAAKTKLVALRTQIQTRRAAGTATQEETEIDDLPAETAIDATWEAGPPP